MWKKNSDIFFCLSHNESHKYSKCSGMAYLKKHPNALTWIHALTLIEVLIAITILSMILSMVYTILMSTLSARELIQSQTHVDRVANQLLLLMSRDIQAAYIYCLEDNICFQGKPDRIDFVCNTDSLVASGDVRSDLSEVGYFLRNNQEEQGSFKLMRREDFFVDDSPLAGGYAIKLYDRVSGLKFQYLHPKEGLKDRWDSKEKKGLPTAVSITLEIRSAPRGSDLATLKNSVRTFKTCVPILVSPNAPEKKEEKPK